MKGRGLCNFIEEQGWEIFNIEGDEKNNGHIRGRGESIIDYVTGGMKRLGKE